jgi:hypothetical protein
LVLPKTMKLPKEKRSQKNTKSCMLLYQIDRLRYFMKIRNDLQVVAAACGTVTWIICCTWFAKESHFIWYAHK